MTEERSTTSSKSTIFSFMPLFGIAILTVSTVFSAIKARNDIPTLAFIISIYVVLVLLFYCLHLHDSLSQNSEKKEKLKIPIWLLATILNVLFAYRVSTILTLPLDILVWAMAACTSLCGFYVFFIYDDKSKLVTDASCNPKNDEKGISYDSHPFIEDKV